MLGLGGGAQRRLEHARLVVGRIPMVGDLGPPTGIGAVRHLWRRGKRLGAGPVKAHSLPGQEDVLGGLPDELVAERHALIVAVVLDDEQAPVDARPQRRVERPRRYPADARQQVGISPSPGDGSHAEERLRLRRHARDPGQEDVAEGRR